MFFIIALIGSVIAVFGIAIAMLVSKCVNRERSPPAIEEDGIVIAEQPDISAVEAGTIQAQAPLQPQEFDDEAPQKG